MMESYEIVLDLTLAATSGAMVLYCGVLSRRLARLRSAKDGVGPALERLGAAVKENQASADAITQAADAAVRRLNAAYAELDAKRQATEDLASVLDGQAARAERRVGEARAEAEAGIAAALAPTEEKAALVVQTTERTLSVLARRARIELEALGDAVDIAGRVASLTDKEEAAPEDRIGSAPVALDAARAVVRQRPAAGDNPFRQAASEQEDRHEVVLRAVGS